MSSVVHYESSIDKCADLLTQHLEEMADSGELEDMRNWFQCYAFDVIGLITYGKRLGFLDRGEDIAGISAALDQNLQYSAQSGIFPSLHPYFIPVKNYLAGSKGAGRKSETCTADEDSVATRDFLTKFLGKHNNDPEVFTEFHVLSGCAQNMFAGSDTTAITLSAVFYYLLKNPCSLEKLRDEVDSHTERIELSRAPTFKETQRMPYLQAVIKEALRMHPATKVGINAWVAHRNTHVFDDDANDFSPERWLKSDKERLSMMNHYFMPMAELLGIVAGGAGLASLAIQLANGGQKLRHRYKDAKDLGNKLSWLCEDLEIMGKQLMQLETDTSSILQQQLGPIMLERCRSRSASIATRLENLTSTIPANQSKKQFIHIAFRSAEVLKSCDNPTCLARRYRFDLRVTLGRYGIPWEMIFGLDVKAELGRYSLQPCLKIQAIVDFTAPGFVILESLAFGELDWTDAEAELQLLYKSDPGLMKNCAGSYFRSFDEDLACSLVAAGCDFRHAMPTSDIWRRNWNLHSDIANDPFDIDMFKIFLQVNPDIGDSPTLHTTVLHSSNENFELLVKKTKQPLESFVNFLGQTPLHIAVRQPSRIAQLLGAGHQVDPQDKYGRTPLVYAAAMDLSETAMILIEHGACLKIPGEKERESLIKIVMNRNNWTLFWKIIDFVEVVEPSLTCQLFWDVFEATIDESCYVAHESDGIQNGCYNFWSRVVSTLGDPNISLPDGRTLMHIVKQSHAARVLIELGFNSFNKRDELGEHSLFKIASILDPSLFRWAVSEGSDINLQNNNGCSVLHQILDGYVNYKHLPQLLEILGFLLDSGVNVSLRDSCLCNCSNDGCVPGSDSWSSLRFLEWLELLEERGKITEAREACLGALRKAYYNEAGLHRTCQCHWHRFYWDIEDAEGQFWDIPQQLKIDALDSKMRDIEGRHYEEMKSELMACLTRRDRTMYKPPEAWLQSRVEPSPRPLPRNVSQMVKEVEERGRSPMKELLGLVLTASDPEIPEPLLTSWKVIIQRFLESNAWLHRRDLGLDVVEFGIGLHLCGGEKFLSRIPLLTQLMEVLEADDEVIMRGKF
ncbi:cytochrome p450 oxidoreductase [Fusarium austroafricanum]|uniref:Cytochrome p450 oxidoreductase n=1 Tax=Fusarium austroafricanum TaxID=2364996 RepID=A0A8H4KG13_9HYPO|nr:cytochrome p450 oxidoreductase [Fusarium austroafricanum]